MKVGGAIGTYKDCWIFSVDDCLVDGMDRLAAIGWVIIEMDLTAVTNLLFNLPTPDT
jgi:hypothetical protein